MNFCIMFHWYLLLYILWFHYARPADSHTSMSFNTKAIKFYSLTNFIICITWEKTYVLVKEKCRLHVWTMLFEKISKTFLFFPFNYKVTKYINLSKFICYFSLIYQNLFFSLSRPVRSRLIKHIRHDTVCVSVNLFWILCPWPRCCGVPKHLVLFRLIKHES